MTATLSAATVIVKRKIAAPAQMIFDAWMNAESLAEWMRPCTDVTAKSTVQADVRVGGAFEIIMHVPSGPVVHTGFYQTIDPPSRLIFTWNSVHAGHHDSLVTVEFLPLSDGTEVVLTHELLPESAKAGHFGGWTSILDSLAQQIGD